MENVLFKLLLVFLTGFLPIAEIRGAVPLAYYFFRANPSLYAAGLTAGLAGNLIVAPLALYLLRFIERVILGDNGGLSFLRKIYVKIINYARRKAAGHEKMEFAGLLVFVAIPLPGTGAWTGALVAHVLGMRPKDSILSINLGVLGAFAIVLLVVEAGATVLKMIFGI
ncbi:MAG: small multi-drug export protein [Thermogladius sp.]|nr:small multi-drug export protein [Thermogladius sp.]